MPRPSVNGPSAPSDEFGARGDSTVAPRAEREVNEALSGQGDGSARTAWYARDSSTRPRFSPGATGVPAETWPSERANAPGPPGISAPAPCGPADGVQGGAVRVIATGSRRGRRRGFRIGESGGCDCDSCGSDTGEENWCELRKFRVHAISSTRTDEMVNPTNYVSCVTGDRSPTLADARGTATGWCDVRQARRAAPRTLTPNVELLCRIGHFNANNSTLGGRYGALPSAQPQLTGKLKVSASPRRPVSVSTTARRWLMRRIQSRSNMRWVTAAPSGPARWWRCSDQSTQ